MALHASVGLSGEDRQKCSFTMPARATKLNKHGAAVQLGRELLVGSVVSVNNKQGTQISARVVAQLAAAEGVSPTQSSLSSRTSGPKPSGESSSRRAP